MSRFRKHRREHAPRRIRCRLSGRGIWQTAKGMRYCPVVLAANGRVKPDRVIVNGQPERHPEGAYYLEWRERGKRVRLSVGKDAADANSRRQRKEAELNALNNGVAVVPDNSDNGQRSHAAAVAEFLDETKLTKKPKTLAAYTTALNYFTESCPKLYVHEIERRDMLKFSAFVMRRTSAVQRVQQVRERDVIP
jgi:integrase/recombinase XerD